MRIESSSLCQKPEVSLYSLLIDGVQMTSQALDAILVSARNIRKVNSEVLNLYFVIKMID